MSKAPKGSKVLNIKQLRSRRAKLGRPTLAESRNDPEWIVRWLRLMKSDVAHDLPIITAAFEGRVERLELLGTFDELIRQITDAKWGQAILLAFQAGRKYAEAELARLAEAEQAMERHRESGREANKLSKPEMQKQLAEWNAMIAPYHSKSQGIEREEIPRATYFKYQKELRKE